MAGGLFMKIFRLLNLKKFLVYFSFCAFFLAFLSQPAKAFNLNKNYAGFVSIGSKELFVDYIAPHKNLPTIVFLNGLTYSTSQWYAMTYALSKKGYGVVRYDMDGQGNTLLRYGVKTEPYHYSDQVLDLNLLLKALNLPKPYNLVGLSYGGGIAAAYTFKYPQNIQKVILMAPYTEALESQDQLIKNQITATRLYYPYNPASNEQLYDFFLKQHVYTTYPLAEPIVLENPLKLEATFRMTQGIRKFVVSEESYKFPAKSVYLFVAEYDQYIPRGVMERFWKSIPEVSQGGFIIIKNSEHKIPESQAFKAVDQITEIFK